MSLSEKSGFRRRTRRGVFVAIAALACVAPSVAGEASNPRSSLDPAARLPEGPGPSEYWDMVGRLDTGHYLFSRFMFTDMGPGDRNAVAIGHVVFPNGDVHRFKNLKPGLAGHLSPDGLRIDVLNSHLDLGTTPARLDVNKRNTQIHMEFTPTGREETPAELARGGFGFGLLDAAAPIRGTFFHPKKAPETLRASGRTSLTHTWTGRHESELANWRVDFVSLDADAPIHLIEIARTDGSRIGWLTAGREGDHRVSTTDIDVRLEGRHAGSTRPGYHVPEQFVLSGSGVTGTVRLGRVLLEQDPLEDLKELNWMIRSLIRPAGQPHRIWIEAPYDVKREAGTGTEQSTSGSGVVVITFFDPTPTVAP